MLQIICYFNINFSDAVSQNIIFLTYEGAKLDGMEDDVVCSTVYCCI